jgi:hypothetical protein
MWPKEEIYRNGNVTLKGVAMALRLLPKTWQNMQMKYVSISTIDGKLIVSSPCYSMLMFEDGKWVTIVAAS